MCLNCGCGQPDDPHGNPANITADKLRRAGRANGQSMETSALNILAGVRELEPLAGAGAGVAGGEAGGGSRNPERGTPATES